MRQKYLWVGLVSLALFSGAIWWLAGTSQAQQNVEGGAAAKPNPIDPLPIRQVILFNSGVGYIQREGDVQGDARIDLSFPTSDINDLLKSLVLQDLDNGKISTVNYDSHDPIEKILRLLRSRFEQQSDLLPNPQPGSRREDRNHDARKRQACQNYRRPSSAWSGSIKRGPKTI